MAPGYQGVSALWWPLLLAHIFLFSIIYTNIFIIHLSFIKVSKGSLKVLKKVLYMYLYYLTEIMKKVEIDNVEEMVEKIVTKDGKIGGLKKHAGKQVIIVVPKIEKK